MSLNMPQIRIEVESMKYQIIHAFSQHNDEIEKAVEQELTRVIENYPFAEVISRMASETLSKAIEESVKDFFVYGEGRKILSQQIEKILTNNLDK